MADTWSPEDEQGFGIAGPDKGALTPEQQKALDDLKVQTARDSHEYLHQHPEVKAMLSLLIRETLLQDRDVRSVAGKLFHSERHVVAAVRRMLGMSPKLPPQKKRRSEEEDFHGSKLSSQVSEQGVTFAEDLPGRGRWADKSVASTISQTTRMRRRDTPVPWIFGEAEFLDRVMDQTSERGERSPTSAVSWPERGLQSNLAMEGSSQDQRQRVIPSTTWLQREVEKLTHSVADRSPLGAWQPAPPVPWMLTGRSSSQLPTAITGDDVQEAEDDEDIPLARRDTPAPWTTEDGFQTEKKERDTYVLGILEKILEEPADSSDVFEKLHQIVEEGDQ